MVEGRGRRRGRGELLADIVRSLISDNVRDVRTRVMYAVVYGLHRPEIWRRGSRRIVIIIVVVVVMITTAQ